jgi:hypothetical protein
MVAAVAAAVGEEMRVVEPEPELSDRQIRLKIA